MPHNRRFPIRFSRGIQHLTFTVLTLFPEMFSALLLGGIIKRAVESKCIAIETVDIRNFATNRHRTVDDRPYGGGCGMVMKPEPLARAIRHAKQRHPESHTVLLTPQGRLFDQRVARRVAQYTGLVLICGRYEGVDERICLLVDEELSIGDYVLTGGEIAAMVVIDVVSRLIPGVLGNVRSADEESFSSGLLEYPQYTRPRSFEEAQVPDILLSGNHLAIKQWRRQVSLARTLAKRPDLLFRESLTPEDIEFLKKLHRDIEAIIERHMQAS
ncbi:MAG: tRNA (guanosine(37)-N1)-methyltransferase TrmD [Deltaproteobacteria bacterium]|nr:tRNA (guanosine(37)-N1)-methyltransferase TrmD [Deltaproteobacteria bacterium]